MSEIVKGVLAGGMALLAGWILPTAINLLAIGLLVAPDKGSVGTRAALLLGAAAVGGLVLNMLQTPLYRILEGYLGWPQWAFERRRRAHLGHKHRIAERLELIRQLRGGAQVGKMPAKDRRRSAPQRALLREELRRYPVDDQQVLPTRLGNAIRRFEEYGWNRYRLDSQTLWSRLVAVVPEAVRKQVDNAQTGVDFFVCLLYGHVLVALTGAVALAAGRPHRAALLAALLLPLLLIPVWYRLAVTTTDQWAAAVQALVDLGRPPLATAYGLTLPGTLEAERSMWERVSRFAGREYSEERGAALDAFRLH